MTESRAPIAEMPPPIDWSKSDLGPGVWQAWSRLDIAVTNLACARIGELPQRSAELENAREQMVKALRLRDSVGSMPQSAVENPSSGMKRPKYAATTAQKQHDAGMNPFAIQLMADAHAEGKSRFGDETIMAVARGPDGTPAFILISTREPTPEQFKDWPV